MAVAARVVLYLGSQGCDAMLAEAARATEPLLVVVPADPRLVGALAASRGIEDDLAFVADVLLARALALARGEMEREARALGATLGAADRARPPPVDGLVLRGLLPGSLTKEIAGGPVRELYAARDALELLSAAGIDVAGALGSKGPRLVAR